MDEQALIRTYGNTDLPGGTEDRPLVTFALFAYNQEKYIREAVEGAFSQTYSPLEIILSDDCSSDRTFEIMEEMAAAYQGPHRVVARRNEINLGTAAHFSIAAARSRGDLLVVAAGDDISLAHRVERLIREWLALGRPLGITHSNMLRFVDGQPLDTATLRRPTKVLSAAEVMEKILKGGSISFFAPTFMYSRDFLEAFQALLGGSIVEDGPMIRRCALVGEFHHIDEPLVYVRSGPENSGTGLTIHRTSHWNRLFRSRMLSAFNLLSDIRHLESRGNATDPRLPAVMTRQIANLSRLIVPESSKASFKTRIRVVYHLLLCRAYRGNIRANWSMALGVLFPDLAGSRKRKGGNP